MRPAEAATCGGMRRLRVKSELLFFYNETRQLRERFPRRRNSMQILPLTSDPKTIAKAALGSSASGLQLSWPRSTLDNGAKRRANCRRRRASEKWRFNANNAKGGRRQRAPLETQIEGGAMVSEDRGALFTGGALVSSDAADYAREIKSRGGGVGSFPRTGECHLNGTPLGERCEMWEAP